MSNYSSLIINQLILIGHRKNYVVPFNPGVNIIYGDSDTGKSSILELINYMLGASKFTTYDEIEASAKYAILELEMNGESYVIKRDIFDSGRLVEVYRCSYDEIETVYPEKYAASFSNKETGHDGFLSDFLFDSLNLPIVKLRQAPSKNESKMIRHSFRDLFKYCYLNQDDVGSAKMLDIGNWAVVSKNKQTFKYIFNVLDESITLLEDEISALQSIRKGQDKKYELVSEFLRDTDFDSAISLEDGYEKLDQEVGILEKELKSTRDSMVANSDKYKILKDVLDQLSMKVEDVKEGISKSELSLDRYSRLKNDYLNDVEKFKSIQLAKQVIGIDLSSNTFCPICESNISLDDIKDGYDVSDSDQVNQEQNSIKRRVRDLESLIESERGNLRKFNVELRGYYTDRDRARRMLDEETSTMISPYLSERDGTISELMTLKEKKNQLGQALKVRNKQDGILKNINFNNKRILALNEKLTELRKAAPSITAITTDLGGLFNRYLKKVNIKNRTNVSIDSSTFLPVIRHRHYSDITSGGLRTIASIGYLTTLLEYSIKTDTNLPLFMMIDTVGKYLGKTKDRYTQETDKNEDVQESVSDPSKYKSIYEHLIKVAEKSEERGRACQIILVDNDVPPNIQEDYKGFVVAHYSTDGAMGLPIGLIDDAGLLVK